MKKQLQNFKRKPYLILSAMVLGAVSLTAQTTRYVRPAPLGVDAGDCSAPASPCASMNYALAQSNPGDSIWVRNGNYTLSAPLIIDKAITIQGQSQNNVSINASSINSGAYPFEITAGNVTIRNMKVTPPSTPSSNYTFHVSGNLPAIESNFKLENITVSGARKTPFDIHGVDNVTLNNLTAINTIAGNAISLSGVNNATVSNITALNNAWGAVAVYVSNYANRGSSNITIDGGSLNIDGPVYQEDDANYSSTGVSVTDWDYRIFNNDFRAGGQYFTFFSQDLTTAYDAAIALHSAPFIPNNSSVLQKMSTGEFTVVGLLDINKAVAKANAGGTVRIFPGTYNIASTINLNKQLTLKGVGTSGPATIQGSSALPGSYFILVSGAGSGSSIQNLDFVKTDKAGPQNLIGIQANNVSIDGCDFMGQWVINDGDVSRATELSGGLTGFSFTNNTVSGLRQPGYLNASSGTISNNTITGSKGWVVDGADINFSGNVFNGNVVDIAILAGTSPMLYTDLFALSNANNNAYFEDQRVSPMITGAAVAYVDAVNGNDGNNGTQASPYATVQRGINRELPGGTIDVAPGTYNEDVLMTKAGHHLAGDDAATTIIRGLYAGSEHTLQIAANNVQVSGVTVTRDNGGSLASWYASTKNQGITINQTISGTVIDGVIVTGNRNGIYGQICPNTTIQNSIIEDNRTGLHFGRDFSNSLIQNNYIRNNFTHGLLFNADFGEAVHIQNTIVRENHFGNWYSDINYQNNTGQVVTPADATGFSATCNYFGTPALFIDNSSTAGLDPSYTSQVPSQFGGTSPNAQYDPVHGHVVGINSDLLLPGMTILESDANTGGMGFHPNGSCITLPQLPRLINADCGRLNFARNELVNAETVPGATQYGFEFSYNNVVIATTTRLNPACPLTLTDLQNYLIPGEQLTVRVRARVNNVYGSYGYPCTIGIGLPKLEPGDCGATGLSKSYKISSNPIANAQSFIFDFYDENDVFVTTITRPANNSNGGVKLNEGVLKTDLLPGNTYKVYVSVVVNGITYGPGEPCTISLANARPGSETITEEETVNQLALYPNPASTQLNVSMFLQGNAVMTVQDMAGRTLAEQTITGEGNTKAVVDVSRFAAGSYMLIIRTEDGNITRSQFVKQ